MRGVMILTIEPEARTWLADKGCDTITIGVIISRGGGCCGGCSFTEAIIDCGEPKEKQENHYLVEQDGLKIYIARILDKKTDALRVGLKGWFFKRLALSGYEAECPLSSSLRS